MLIHVTEKDIREGRRQNCDCCPIALALLRETKHAWRVGKSSLVKADGWACRVQSTQEVKDFVDRFDRGEPVQPFTFELPE